MPFWVKKNIQLDIKSCRVCRKLNRLKSQSFGTHPVRSRHSVLVMEYQHRIVDRIARAINRLLKEIHHSFERNVLMLVTE
ncbi:hypothetical protein D3C78_713160 [compost metagenome]